jgi:lipopolysaccharide export LptBFGC system permease protein LptF
VTVLAASGALQTHPLYVFLLLLAVVLLGLAAFGVGHPRVSLGWLGLACWALYVLLVLGGWG